MQPPQQYALSLKQPWAALLAHGLKTIEIRKWPPTRRGRILIHAARVSDPRPAAWQLVPAQVLADARRVGGIIGAGDLVDYVVYRSRAEFAAHQARHLNDPAWFEGRHLFGFIFKNTAVLPFRPYPGWMRFFPVEPDDNNPV